MPHSTDCAPNRLIFSSANRCADLRYESGFNAEDDFLWFSTKQLTAIAVHPLEYGRAVKQRRSDVQVLDRTHLREALKLSEVLPEKYRDVSNGTLRDILSISEAFDVTNWQVPYDFPCGLAQNLAQYGVTVSPIPRFSPAREIKRADEVENVRKAQRIAEAGLAQADRILAASIIGNDGLLYYHGELITAEILRGAINAEIARLGGNPSGTIAAPGPQGADPHQVGSGPIAANSPIIMDIFPRDEATGYFGDLTRTRVKGKAPEIVRKTYETVLEAQQRVLETLKPDTPCCDYHNMVVDFFKQQGYQTGWDAQHACYYGFFHGLGHSVGLEIHESPSLSRGVEKLLTPGNVVTVEPGLYYPAWGGIRIEDTVAITTTGIDNLTVAPKFLEIE